MDAANMYQHCMFVNVKHNKNICVCGNCTSCWKFKEIITNFANLLSDRMIIMHAIVYMT